MRGFVSLDPMPVAPKLVRYLVLLLALPLAGCFDQQQAQMAKCKLDAQAAGIAPETLGAGTKYMSSCMVAAGYQINFGHPKCQPTADLPVWMNVYCFNPAKPFQKLLYRVEMPFR
jgi:hypothetical protein